MVKNTKSAKELKNHNITKLLAHLIAIIGVIFVLFIYLPVGLLLIGVAAYIYVKARKTLDKGVKITK